MVICSKFFRSQVHYMDMVLSIEHRQAGLSLREDEDFVYLSRHGKEVCRWYNGPSLKVETILKEADTWLPHDAVIDAIKEGGIEIGHRN